MKKYVRVSNARAMYAATLLNDTGIMDKIETLPVSEKLRIRDMIRGVLLAATSADKKRLELVVANSELDENGSPVPSGDGPGLTVINDYDKFSGELQDLLSEECEVDIPVTKYGSLAKLVLPLAFIDAFDGILIE
jgi:hypothetical protein